MNTTTTEFVIDQEGNVYREDRTRRHINPGDELQKAFSAGHVTKLYNFMDVPGHSRSHLIYEEDTTTLYCMVRLTEINLRTSFSAGKNEETGESEFYPTFGGPDNPQPIIEIPWNLQAAFASQEAMPKVYFVAMLRPVSSASDARWRNVDHYLYAFDERKAAYRLPLANLYETCRVCMGDYASLSPTVLGAVLLALEQFRKASWNSDLFNDQEITRKVVRFKPLEKGFETLPVRGTWTEYCDKVATANLKLLTLP